MRPTYIGCCALLVTLLLAALTPSLACTWFEYSLDLGIDAVPEANEETPGVVVGLYPGDAGGVLTLTPEHHNSGEVRLAVEYTGSGRISIWDANNTRIDLPKTWDQDLNVLFPDSNGNIMPLGIRGEAMSSAPGDILITATYVNSTVRRVDKVRVTVGHVPTVSFTDPNASTTQVTARTDGKVNIEVLAQDPNDPTDPNDSNDHGVISKVQFQVYKDGNLVTEADGQPVSGTPYHYNYSWTPGQDGPFVLKAIAIDGNGCTATVEKPLTIVLDDATTEEADPNAYDSLKLWLSAEKENISTADSWQPPIEPNADANVYHWVNRAPNKDANSLVQSTLAYRPTWIQSDPNLGNKPAVWFDGNDRLAVNPGNYSQNTVIMMVVQVVSADANDTLYNTGASGPTYANVGCNGTTVNLWTVGLNGIVPASSYAVITMAITGDRVRCYKNGVPIKDGVYDLSDSGYPIDGNALKWNHCYQLAGRYGVSGGYPQFNLAELAVYKGASLAEGDMDNLTELARTPALERADQVKVERHLMTKYGIARPVLPTVRIVSPAQPATATAGGTIQVKAAAFYPTGTTGITCKFYGNGVLMGTGTLGQQNLFTWDWANAKPGIYRLKAVAEFTDASIPTTTSQEVEVRVYAPASTAGDSDGDGIPDWWELAHFGNLDANEQADSDGDGNSNSYEYSHSTNPSSSDANVPALLGMWPPPGSTVPLPVQGSPLVLSTLFSKGDSASTTVTDGFGNDMKPFMNFLGGGAAELEIDLPRKCVEIDANEYASADGNAFSGMSQFTISGWAWRDANDPNLFGCHTILTNAVAGSDGGFKLYIDTWRWDEYNRWDGKIVFETRSDSEPNVQHMTKTGEGVFKYNHWNHIAVVVKRDTNPPTATIYVNGRDSTVEPNMCGDFQVTRELFIGALKGNPQTAPWDGSYLRGRLADLRIYGQALDANQIATVMAGNSLNAKLLRQWKFDDGSGTTAKDSSGNGGDATVHAGANFLSDEKFLSGINYAFKYTVNGKVFDLFFRVDPTLPQVEAGLKGGLYEANQSVTLTASEPNCVIYYSTDGVPPTVGSSVYSAPLAVNKASSGGNTVVLQYFAIDTAGNQGPMGKQVYFFGQRPDPVTGFSAQHLPPGSGPSSVDRVECLWSGSLVAPQGYYVYRAVNAADVKLLRDCKAAGHKPPSSLRASTLLSADANAYVDSNGITPAGSAWYGVTQTDANGTESTVCNLVKVDLSTTQSIVSQDPNVAVPAATARAAQWLNSTQAEEGYWGSPGSRIRATCQALNALRRYRWHLTNRLGAQQGLMYLRGNFPDNNADMASMLYSLRKYGVDPNWHFEDVRGVCLRLAMRVNDRILTDFNYFGWGMQARYYFDAYDTSLAILAMNEVDANDRPTWFVPCGGNYYPALYPARTSGRYGWSDGGQESVYVSCLAYSALNCLGYTNFVDSNWFLGANKARYSTDLAATAAVLLWSPVSSDQEKTDARMYLVSQQSVDGSWQGDPFLTALCLEALLK